MYQYVPPRHRSNSLQLTHRSALPTFGRHYQPHAINFLVLYKIIGIMIGTLLCTCSYLACYYVKSVNYDLGDVVENYLITADCKTIRQL